MNTKEPVNLRSFKRKMLQNRTSVRRYLTKIEKQTPRGLDKATAALEKEVWKEIDCLNCANCCKTMTPTFTAADLKRIAAHFNQTVDAFKEKWLYKERSTGDWMNKKQPCQFLDLKTNMCSIYEVRPIDCAGFPHLQKKLKDYVHVHKQNVEYCPATYTMVQKIRAWEAGEITFTKQELENAEKKSDKMGDMSLNSGPVEYSISKKHR